MLGKQGGPMANTVVTKRRTWIDKAWKWVDDRLGIEELTYAVPAHANNVLYTLGGITAFGILVLILTGIYLTQFYHGDPTQGRQSVEYIITTARLGDFVRSLHFWMANLVAITLFLHALRVFVTGSYRAPRELNWIVGVGLLSVMLGFVFTGTVLKWDQEGWEALQHNEEIGKLVGGLGVWFTTEFTSSTPILQRLFIAHVAILPLSLVGLMALHFFLLKHHGISSIPGHEEARPTEKTDTQAAVESEGSVPFANHILHIAGWGLLLTALGSVLALVISAPLGDVIEPGEEKTKPLWMFLPLYPFEDWIGIKALLWMPIGAIAGLAAVPFIDRYGSSSLRRRWILIAAAVVVIAALVALAIYAQASGPGKHIPGMEGG
jgi:ubiquinol-cytochrome c reductase cytochrome b subunit